MKTSIPKNASCAVGLSLLWLWASLENSHAVEFEPMGKALAQLLGTPKAFRKSLPGEGQEVTVYYAKDEKGQASRIAMIEKGIYPPNCTHTWAIGLEPTSGKVTEVRVLEASCQHAFPIRSANFLDQFKGKGPVEAAKLESQVRTIAKATGSCNLTAEAVRRSVQNWSRIKGQL